MRKLRGTFSLWWVSHQHHTKVQLWPAPCHPSQDMLPSHLPCLSLIPHLNQQPVPSQSPCAGQSLPHSHFPCLHSGPFPSLPSWAGQPNWLCVSLSVPSSTPKDLTKPKAAGHSTRARCGFSKRVWVPRLYTQGPGWACSPLLPQGGFQPGGMLRDTHHIPLHWPFISHSLSISYILLQSRDYAWLTFESLVPGLEWALKSWF